MTDQSQLRRLLSNVRLLMLDFDGPVCRIFAGYPAPVIADELRRLVARRGLPLSDQLLNTRDPLHVLRLVGATGNDALTAEVATALRDAELKATETAKPTAGVLDLVAAATTTGRALAIVSNNSREAVTAYLHRHGLESSFVTISGRSLHEPPQLMKPNPHLVLKALGETNTYPNEAILIGDSVSDVVAAKSAAVAAIGFRPDRTDLSDLVDAGADATIESLNHLTRILMPLSS
jgi:HAD superfamily hydrolase (TIGR01549 family)